MFEMLAWMLMDTLSKSLLYLPLCYMFSAVGIQADVSSGNEELRPHTGLSSYNI